jgi:hypothetical protein
MRLEDELAPLTRDNNAYDQIIKDWFANGVSATSAGPYGMVSPTSDGCTYTAPGKAPGQGKNPVNLSVTLKNLKYKDPTTGAVFNDLQVAASVKIIGEVKYDVSIKFSDPEALTGGLIGATFLLEDSASLRVVIDGDSVILSDFKNIPGVVSPNSQDGSLRK